MWIVSEHGAISGRQDDYVFEAGKIYEFVISLYSINDGVAVTITDPTQGVENTTVETKAVKVIHDGQLVIERDGKTFNAQGAQVR